MLSIYASDDIPNTRCIGELAPVLVMLAKSILSITKRIREGIHAKRVGF